MQRLADWLSHLKVANEACLRASATRPSGLAKAVISSNESVPAIDQTLFAFRRRRFFDGDKERQTWHPFHSDVQFLRIIVFEVCHAYLDPRNRFITCAKPLPSLPFSHAFFAPSIRFPHMAVHGVPATFVCSLESFLF
jgi:hypothetical protein